MLGRGFEPLAPNNNSDVVAASGGGRWCASVSGHHYGLAIPFGFCMVGCPKGYANNILGVSVPAMKLVGLVGTCMGIAQRQHDQQQRSGRIVVGLRLVAIGLCLIAICLGLRKKSTRLVRVHWTLPCGSDGSRREQGASAAVLVSPKRGRNLWLATHTSTRPTLLGPNLKSKKGVD